MPTGMPILFFSIDSEPMLTLFQFHSGTLRPRLAVRIPPDSSAASTEPREGEAEEPAEGLSVSKE
jgi:hypothetical protein